MILIKLVLWPLLTSLCPSRPVTSAVVWSSQTGTETSQGKSCLFPSAPAGIYPRTARMTIGPPRPLPGYPDAQALLSGFCSSGPSFALRFLQTPLATDALA